MQRLGVEEQSWVLDSCDYPSGTSSWFIDEFGRLVANELAVVAGQDFTVHNFVAAKAVLVSTSKTLN